MSFSGARWTSSGSARPPPATRRAISSLLRGYPHRKASNRAPPRSPDHRVDPACRRHARTAASPRAYTQTPSLSPHPRGPPRRNWRAARSATDAGTLLHMALACRACFDPAVDALWRTIPDPRYLLMVLPENIRAVQQNGGQRKLARRPTAAQWTRFTEYARRVQVLEDTEYVTGTRSPRFALVDWDSFLQYFPDGQVLPNLRSYTVGAHLGPDAAVARDYATLFVKPPLRHLTFYSFEIRPLEPLFDAITACSETPETLAIRPVCWGDPDDLDYDIDTLIQLSDTTFDLPTLVSLDVPMLFSCALDHLATLPGLRELRFTIDEVDVDPRAPPLMFPALEHLNLTVRIDDPFPPAAFLRQLVAPVLHDLVFHYDFGNHPFAWSDDPGPPTPEYLQDLFEAVTTLPSLRSFELDCWGNQIARELNIVDASALLPLLPLADLERLDVRRAPFHLVPRDLERMARAWPRMHCLRLGDLWRNSTHRESHLDVGGLLALARLFPDLTTLGVPVWIYGPSTRPSSPVAPYSPLPALKALKVPRSTTTSLSGMAPPERRCVRTRR
ncbi:hypothetical protein PsYK624_118250 [Phanerochaete sordida]|uniref:F-box domain-containing protein n=1 Tax=Phanerochaete sordida TaxID=48140 RepID=A0A9P3GJX6_9APHY|nr:hypothetical protein PsYK624_118250 [Phanerochaete sordida]